jgi:hypothetical protein
VTTNDLVDNISSNVLIAPNSSSMDTSESYVNVDITNTESSSLDAPIPIIRCVDKPSSSIPNKITVSEDFLRASMGFRRIDTTSEVT